MMHSFDGAQPSPCPACAGTRFRKLFTKKGRDFWKCESCGLEKQHPLPTLEELRDYYDRSYSEGMYKTFADAGEMKRMTARQRLEELKPWSRPGRWLDVGCANGVFVEHVRSLGIEGEGIELSEVAVADARSRGLPVFRATVEEFAPGHAYDTVTSFDVLEHVLDPLGYLGAVRKLMAPGGVAVLTMPDLSSLVRVAMGPRWYFYIPEEHLHYFDPRTVRAVLRRAGFEPIRVASTAKPLTYSYSLTQFAEYNPTIYRVLHAASRLMPKALLEAVVPLHIGELMAIGRREG